MVETVALPEAYVASAREQFRRQPQQSTVGRGGGQQTSRPNNIYPGPGIRDDGLRASGRGHLRGRGKPKCQMCLKIGHIAVQCYHRMNPNYQSYVFGLTHGFSPYPTQPISPQGMTAYMIEPSTQPHLYAPASSTSHLPYTAFFLDPSYASTTQSPSYSSKESWVLDIGATHHFTPSLDGMSMVAPYRGKSQVMVSSGKTVPILHVGKKILC